MNKNITKDTFNKLMKSAGLNKKELSKISGIPYATITNWGYRAPYPPFIVFLLESYIQNKQYQNKIKNVEVKAAKYDKIKEYLSEVVTTD